MERARERPRRDRVRMRIAPLAEGAAVDSPSGRIASVIVQRRRNVREDMGINAHREVDQRRVQCVDESIALPRLRVAR
jgi:hypothetical protein